MKKSLTDGIEQYVKVLIARSEHRQIEIQRAELAETFGCVPSQVTYAVSTRFNRANGYYTESRRGGMGYLRIAQIKPEDGDASEQGGLLQAMNELGRQKILCDREMELLQFIVDYAPMYVPREYQDQVSLGISAGLRKFVEVEALRYGKNKDVM